MKKSLTVMGVSLFSLSLISGLIGGNQILKKKQAQNNVGKVEVVTSYDKLLEAIKDSNISEIVVEAPDSQDYSSKGIFTLKNGTVLDGKNKTIKVKETGLDEQGTLNELASNISLFSVESNANVTIKNMTIQGGSASVVINGENKNSLDNNSTLTLDNCTIKNTGSNSLESGTVINTKGSSLVIKNSNIKHNASLTGAAVQNNYGLVVIDNSSISENRAFGNSAAGIQNIDGTMYINNSTIANNISVDNAGGIVNSGKSDNAYMAILNSSIIANATETSSVSGLNSNNGFVFSLNSLFAENYSIASDSFYDINITNESDFRSSIYGVKNADFTNSVNSYELVEDDYDTLFAKSKKSIFIDSNNVIKTWNNYRQVALVDFNKDGVLNTVISQESVCNYEGTIPYEFTYSDLSRIILNYPTGVAPSYVGTPYQIDNSKNIYTLDMIYNNDFDVEGISIYGESYLVEDGEAISIGSTSKDESITPFWYKEKYNLGRTIDSLISVKKNFDLVINEDTTLSIKSFEISASVNAATVTLDWTNLEGVEGYNIYKGLYNDFSKAEKIQSNLDGNTNQITNLCEQNALYYFWVEPILNDQVGDTVMTSCQIDELIEFKFVDNLLDSMSGEHYYIIATKVDGQWYVASISNTTNSSGNYTSTCVEASVERIFGGTSIYTTAADQDKILKIIQTNNTYNGTEYAYGKITNYTGTAGINVQVGAINGSVGNPILNPVEGEPGAYYIQGQNGGAPNSSAYIALTPGSGFSRVNTAAEATKVYFFEANSEKLPSTSSDETSVGETVIKTSPELEPIGGYEQTVKGNDGSIYNVNSSVDLDVSIFTKLANASDIYSSSTSYYTLTEGADPSLSSSYVLASISSYTDFIEGKDYYIYYEPNKEYVKYSKCVYNSALKDFVEVPLNADEFGIDYYSNYVHAEKTNVQISVNLDDWYTVADYCAKFGAIYNDEESTISSLAPGYYYLRYARTIYTWESYPCEVEVKAKEINDLVVSNDPDNMQYMSGNELDLTGTYISINYTDGTTEKVSYSDFINGNFDGGAFYETSCSYAPLQELSASDNNKHIEFSVTDGTKTITASSTNALEIIVGVEKPSEDLTEFFYNGSEQIYGETTFNYAGVYYDVENNVKKDARTYTVTVTLKNGYAWENNNDGVITYSTEVLEFTFIIKPSLISVDSLTFEDQEVEYDGNIHKILVQGDLPDGVSVSYKVNNMYFNGARNVGEYIIVASFNDVNFNYTGELSAKLTILNKKLGVSLNNKTVTYDGTNKTIDITGSLPEGITVSYEYFDSDDNKLDNPYAISAGTYTVKATFTDTNIDSAETTTSNYDLTSLEATLTIIASDIQGITFDNSTVDYDGNSHMITIGGTTLPAGVEVEYICNGSTFEGAENAGTYLVTAHFEDTTGNYATLPDITATLTINKIIVSIPEFAYEVNYNGYEQSANVVSNFYYEVSSEKGTNVGEYYIKLKLKNVNFIWEDNTSSDKELTWRINSIKLKVEATQKTISYGESLDGFISITGFVGEDNESIVDKTNLSFDTQYTTTSNAGIVYYLTPKGLKLNTSAQNYTFVYVSTTMKVEKAKVVKPTADSTTFTYNGSEQTYSVEKNDAYTISNNQKTNAGTYQVTVSLNDTVNYEWEDGTTSNVQFSFVINKKQVTKPTEDTTSFTYNGETQTYGVSSTTDYTVINNSKTNAGSYNVIISLNDTSNTVWSDGTTSNITYMFTINKQTLTGITLSDATVNYDGNAHSITISGTLPTGVSVSYVGNEQTNAGTYTVEASFTDSTGNYNAPSNMDATLTINKVKVNKPTADSTTYTYNAEEQTYTVASSTLYSVTGNTQTNAGSYSVTISLNDKTNYVWEDDSSGDLTYTFVINKATYDMSSVSFEDVTTTYNGEEKTIVISGTLPEGVEVSYTTNTLTNAGSIEVTASFTGDSTNYELIESKTATLTINKAKVAKPDEDSTTFTYTGAAQTYGISSTSNYTVSNNQQTNAGTYQVTVSLNDKTNYCWSDDTNADLEFTFVINKQTLTGITFEDVTLDYDGNEHALSVSGAIPEGITVIYTGNNKTKAGTYQVSATFVDSTGNYNVPETMTATLTINKIAISGITFDNDTVDYDGEAHSLFIEGTLPEGMEVIYEGNGQVNAGEYEITATFIDTTGNNIVPSPLTATLTINKVKVIAPEENTSSFTYNKEAQTYEVTLNDNYQVSNNVQTNAGTYQVTVSLNDKTNYCWSDDTNDDLEFTFVISKQTILGITFQDDTQTYDGSTKSLEISGTLPEGVVVSYVNNEQINVGNYLVNASFVDTTGNYNVPEDMTATLIINKAIYDMSSVAFSNVVTTYDGNEKTLIITGNLPEGVEVSYTTNTLTNAGSIEVIASFTGDSTNYELIESKIATLTINKAKVSKPVEDITTFTYNGSEQTYLISQSTEYSIIGNTQINAGTYVVTVTLVDKDNFEWEDETNSDLTFSFIINKLTVDVVFEDLEVVYDGEAHELVINSSLPTGIITTYSDNNYLEVGTYQVTVTLVDTTGNYDIPSSLTATLIIKEDTNVEEQKSDLIAKADEAKEGIDSLPLLTDEEKEEYKKEIDKLLTEYLDEIDNNKTNADEISQNGATAFEGFITQIVQDHKEALNKGYNIVLVTIILASTSFFILCKAIRKRSKLTI